MKFFGKTLGLLLASLALASCGGGGGDGGTFVAPKNGSITLSADRTSLPVNLDSVSPFIGSPYMATISVSFRNANGTLMAPAGEATFTISDPNIATMSYPDDPSTADINEFTLRLASFHQLLNNGSGNLFVTSWVKAGTTTLTASAVDPNTGQTVTQTLPITVTTGVGTAPATVEMAASPQGVYLPSSGGLNASSISATVRDGGGQLIADPVSGNSGNDNVKFEIVGDAGDGSLSTDSVAGPVSGKSVSSHTVHGIATASFQAGEQTPQGPVQIRATVDRTDNNVTNGIQDPVSVTTSVIVSDGKLYSVKITSPDTNSILVNGVSDDPTVDPTTDPDGTYSMTVSALATDRQGNPVLPGTPIRFGLIDEPVGTFDSGATANQFLLAGGDGNPQEGGTTFTAPTGHFTTAGGGAGPGDALVVFGKTQHGAPQGNEDLESAVTVQRVVNGTNLVTASPFNRNDTTGTMVDNGSVLPYLIGRSQHGNITTTAATDELGVAHASLNYTVKTLGHIAAMWAQGDGVDRVSGGARRVTDAVQLLYPGIAPAQLVAYPSPIPGNKTVDVTVCLRDAMNSPIQGINIGFQMNLGGGTGSVDGNGTSGSLDNTTGPDGCAVASVQTSGMPISTTDAASGQVVFSVGDASASVDIVVQLAFLSNGGVGGFCSDHAPAATATIRAYTTDGSPAVGATIDASCSGVSVDPASAQTGANGSASFTLTGDPGATGSCTFTAGDVAPLTVSVRIPDGDDFSPPCVSAP